MENTNKINDKFDFIIFSSIILLTIIGLFAIYSATNNHPTAQGNFQKQLFTSVLAISFILCSIFYSLQNLSIYCNSYLYFFNTSLSCSIILG